MHNIHQALDRLDQVCESKQELITYHLPELNQVVATIKLLPRGQQEEYVSRLERISMILEGQMMELADELAELKKQIPAVKNSSAAALAYRRTVASIPVNKTPANNNAE